jgi:hypothetical protein
VFFLLVTDLAIFTRLDASRRPNASGKRVFLSIFSLFKWKQSSHARVAGITFFHNCVNTRPVRSQAIELGPMKHHQDQRLPLHPNGCVSLHEIHTADCLRNVTKKSCGNDRVAVTGRNDPRPGHGGSTGRYIDAIALHDDILWCMGCLAETGRLTVPGRCRSQSSGLADEPVQPALTHPAGPLSG